MVRQRPPASDFDSVLDFCASEMRAGRRTLNECLSLYPELAARLHPLLKAASIFADAQRLSMRRAARDALEQQLRARMARLPAPRRAPASARSPRGWLRWATIAAAAAIVLAAASVGTLAASVSSLPGDVLYPVKRWSETAALQLASGSERAQLQLAWAERRLDEFQRLSAAGVVNVAVLRDFEDELRAAAAIADTLPDDHGAAVLARAGELSASALEAVSATRAGAVANLDQSLAALAALGDEITGSALPTPEPTATATQTNTPTRTPTSTRTMRPTRTLTSLPPVSGTPVESPTRTPPGQEIPGGGPTPTPSSENTPGSGLTGTPPGQGTPGGGLTPTPPGQGTPGGGLTPTPPGQGTPGGGPPDQPLKPTKKP